MKKTETYLIIVILVSYVAHILNIQMGSEVFGLSTFGLGSFYLIFGLVFFNNIPLKGVFKKSSYVDISFGKKVGSIGLGFGLSIAIYGSLFMLLKLPGGLELIIISTTTLFSAIPVLLFKLISKEQDKSTFYTKILFRIIPILLLSTYLIYTVWISKDIVI